MNTCLIEKFKETVNRIPNQVAVIHKSETISFGELNAKARCVASYLLEKVKVSLGKPIAIYLPKEINTIIADISAMYAGCPFVNLDVKTPRERICNTLSLIMPEVVVTSRKYEKFFETINISLLFIEEIKWQEDENLLLGRSQELIDTDPFCIINTSGSTGTPKGVILNHRSFFDFMAWAIERFGFDGSEIIGSLSPVVFDIYDFELCMMMLCGSQLVLLDSTLASFPVRLLETVIENRVNFIFWVPSIMVNIANLKLLEELNLECLKMIWFAGEVFPTKQFLNWYDRLPNTTFVNLYGPIEITLDCTYHVIKDRPDENLPLPIGIPCRNTDILILNENQKKCAVMEEGELCVRGTSLAMGYYNNPEKTSAAFTQNPLNTSYPELIYRTGDVVYADDEGIIHFKGRKDSLIKHLGYRIELGEIENALINDLKIVEYCCAVYRYSEKEIILYYESNEEITPQTFRNSLKTVFPSYMLPAQFIRLDLLPRNANGKIDRLLLKDKANKE